MTDGDRVDPLPHRGDGFVLRRLTVEDLRAFQAYRGDAELGRYQGWTPMPDADATVFLVAMHAAPFMQPGQWTQIGIAGPDGERLVGDIGIFCADDERHAEIGFTLSRPAQGRGIATAAVRDAINLIFAASGVERVIGVTDSRNLPSVRLLERVGMRRIATLDAIFRGESCQEHTYSLDREDVQNGRFADTLA